MSIHFELKKHWKKIKPKMPWKIKTEGNLLYIYFFIYISYVTVVAEFYDLNIHEGHNSVCGNCESIFLYENSDLIVCEGLKSVKMVPDVLISMGFRTV